MSTEPNFTQARETRIILDLFKTIKTRDPQIVTHQDIQRATSKKLDFVRGSIATALKRARKEYGLVIENDRGIGYRLCVDREISTKCGRSAIERGRRIDRIAIEKMNCADKRVLSSEERANHDTTCSVLELRLLASRQRTISSVTQMVMRKHNELDQQELLEAAKAALMST
jgi:hypothetical protein